MSTDRYRDDDSDDCPPPPPDDPNCKPELIDDVACRARGIAAQAAYNATYQPHLETARNNYNTARKEYRAKRQEAALQVQDLRHQIKHLLERIKCQIEQPRVWKCIKVVFKCILADLEECDSGDGCCDGHCDFEDCDTSTLSLPDLVKRIAEYQAWVDKAKECFAKLVAEPGELGKRLASAKAEVDAISAALQADPATTDLKKLYAMALVASWHIEHIWGRFDVTQKYVDCLCRELTCWTKGSEAVSVLTGAKAVAECKEEAAKARCERLRTSTVDEILAEYDRRCSPPPCEPERPEPDDCDDDPDDHDDDSDCDDDNPGQRRGGGKGYGRSSD